MIQEQGGAPQAPQGEAPQGGDLAQMVAAIEKALQTLAQLEGPGAQEFGMALEAFEAGLEKMQGGGGSPAVSPQAGGNPNAKPMA